MKNTNTTLRELSHKYASILRKCALLNAMVLSAIISTSSSAQEVTGDLNILAGDTYNIPTSGMNVSNLTMTNTSKLKWGADTPYYGYNSVNIDNALFSGEVDMGGASEGNHDVHVIHTTNTTFKDVTVIGHLNPAKEGNPNIDWGDYSSFWSNQLTVTGTVNITGTQISMEVESVKGPDFFRDGQGNPYPAFDLYKSNYADGTTVVWNGGLYTTDTTKQQGTFSDAFFKDLAQKVTNGALVSTNEMDQFTHLVGMGTKYKAGDVIQIVGTNKYLESIGLISNYAEGQDNALQILAYEVKGDVTTLTPANVLNAQKLPVEYESGVTISDAAVTLDHSSLSALQYIDPMLKTAQAAEYVDLYQKNLSTLTNLSESDQEVITRLAAQVNSDFFASCSDAFWNILRDYTGSNSAIKEAYDEADAIHEKYRNEATKAENLPYSIKNSSLVVGNNSDVQKGSSGEFLIDNSTITLWGRDEEIANKDDDDGPGNSGVYHFGAMGDLFIQNGSIVNIYSNSVFERDAEQGNIYVINSTINMNGSLSMAGEGEATDGASFDLDSIKDGNIQLTQSSLLNVTGKENYVYSSNAGIDLQDPDWQNKAKANALYVNGSQIVVNQDSSLELWHYDVSKGDEDHESEDGVAVGGTIALDQNGVVDLKGTLDADIVSLTPAVTITDAMTKEEKGQLKLTDNFGTVNLYNGAQLNGIIDGVNVFVKENTALKGDGLTIQGGAVLNLGTNLLTTTALSSNASLIETTIASQGSHGALNVDNLTFENSLVRVNVDMNLEEGQSVTIPFLTGDTEELTSDDFYNTMYDFVYENGNLTLTRNGNSGMISVDELNKVMSAADAWSNPDSFASGSPAQIVAMRLNNLKSSDPSAFEKIVKKLQPEDVNHNHQVANQTNQQVVGAANDRMGGSGHYGNNGNHGNGNHGNNNAHTNNGNHNGTGGQNTNGNHYGTQVAGKSGGDTFNNVGMWVQGLYNHAKLSGSDGYTGKSKGVAMGMDGMVTDNLKLGFGYAYSTTDVDADGNNTDVDTHTGMLYGEYTFGNAFVNAAGTYGYSKYDGKRDLLGQSIKSDYHMDALYGQVMTGYNFDLTNISLTPETGLRYLWTKTHSYTEKPIDQHVSSNKSTTLTGVVGGRMGMMLTTEKATFMPELKLAATYDLDRDNGSSSVRLANGASYVVEGESLKRFGVETGAKIGMTIDNMDFSLSYEGRFKKDYQDHTGMINFRYNF